MWIYIIRRLLVMLPTLFGVTVVAFLIMQLAPGDPLKNQLGVSGLAGQSTQTREAYLLQKRQLKLDKPLVLNFNYFRDYNTPVELTADLLGKPAAEIAKELPALAKAAESPASATPEQRRQLDFLRSLRIEAFDTRLADPEQHARLATAIRGFVEIYAEDVGLHGVPPVIRLLRSEKTTLPQRIGAINALARMVVDPFTATYTREPSAAQTPEIVAIWKLWWERAQADDAKLQAEQKPLHYPPLTAERREALQKRFQAILDAPDRQEMFRRLEFFDPDQFEPFQPGDMQFFVEKLTGETSLQEKAIAATALASYVGRPLETDVPLDASEEQVKRVAENWQLHYQFHERQYDPSLPMKFWDIVADTQYAHMAWRLVTFNFGRSALRTREPVGEKIWRAVIVSAPIMVFSELVIYLVAVPLGILCAVNRGRWLDRLISFKLFVLYSIPAFVAGMLFLLFFAYGDYLKIFPMEGLHSEWANDLGPVGYGLDYLWHAFLPVVCLSLFSLAGMAMYSRSSMLDVVGQDYIRTARAKGVSEPKVILKHALRNALIPIITLFANFLPAMLGGSVLVEYIFGVPGMGRLSWASIEQKDFPTLMALIYIDAILVMISILLTDMLYVLVDPRISFEGQGKAA